MLAFPESHGSQKTLPEVMSLRRAAPASQQQEVHWPPLFACCCLAGQACCSVLQFGSISIYRDGTGSASQNAQRWTGWLSRMRRNWF